MKRTLRLILIVIILGILFGWNHLKGRTEKVQVKESMGLVQVPSDASDSREMWKKLIDEQGPEQAYGLFVKRILEEEYSKQHIQAHYFGESLYEVMGNKGVSICGGEIGFGCYHGVIGRAVKSEGIEVVAGLEQECIKKWGEKGLGCFHGIGHGVQSDLGDGKLQNSLQVCDSLTWKEPIGGCSSGVFMEYNFRTMDSSEGVLPREFNASKPFFPCNEITNKYRQSCFFEIPQWFSALFTNDWGKIGGLCGTLSGDDKDNCWIGLGYAVAQAEFYNVENTIRGCETAGRNNAEETMCKAGAAWNFYTVPEKRDLYKSLCSGVDQDLCLIRADVIGELGLRGKI